MENYLKNIEGLKLVIVRADKAGVHLGFIDETKTIAMSGGYAVELLNTRRIWSWSGANSLSDLAIKGSQLPKECKITAPVSKNRLFAIEIIDVSDLAKKNFDNTPEWTF